MLQASEWDFLHIKEAPKQNQKNRTSSNRAVAAVYVDLLIKLMSDGKTRNGKEIAYKIGAGQPWVSGYMKTHGVKHGKFWGLK